MAEFPIFPVHTDKFLSDTLHMTAEEVGAYCLILFAMWREGGRLHTSDLQNISRLSAHRFEKSRERILRPLTVVGNVVSQKRLEDIRLKVREKRKQAQDAADARWNKKSHASAYANGYADAMPKRYEMPSIKISKEDSSLSLVTNSERPALQQERRASEPEVVAAPRLQPPPQQASPQPSQTSRAEYDARLEAKRTATPEPEAPRRKITMAEYAEIMRARHG